MPEQNKWMEFLSKNGYSGGTTASAFNNGPPQKQAPAGSNARVSATNSGGSQPIAGQAEGGRPVDFFEANQSRSQGGSGGFGGFGASAGSGAFGFGSAPAGTPSMYAKSAPGGGVPNRAAIVDRMRGQRWQGASPGPASVPGGGTPVMAPPYMAAGAPPQAMSPWMGRLQNRPQPGFGLNQPGAQPITPVGGMNPAYQQVLQQYIQQLLLQQQSPHGMRMQPHGGSLPPAYQQILQQMMQGQQGFPQWQGPRGF